MIGGEFVEKAIDVNVGGRLTWAAVPADFCDDVIFLARDIFHSHREIGMGAVLVSKVKSANAAFECITEEAMKIFAAETCLVRLLLHAAGAGPHSQAGNFQAGL